MNHAKRALLGAAVVLGLAACAGSGVRLFDAPARQVQVPPESRARLVLNVDGEARASAAPEWRAFRAEWEAAFKAEAEAAGTAFVWQDGPVKPLGQAGTLLAVHVLDYRHVAGAPGNAYVSAQMRYMSLADGRPFGERNVNTVASASPGGVASTSARQVRAVAAEVMKDLAR